MYCTVILYRFAKTRKVNNQSWARDNFYHCDNDNATRSDIQKYESESVWCQNRVATTIIATWQRETIIQP